MKNLARRIEELFIVIAFAEEREINSFKAVAGCLTEWLDNYCAAITFAEAGEFDAARDFIGGGSGDRGYRGGEYCVPGFCAGRA